ncbi:pirin family protein [Pedobacter jamesrossensis]|uniref:Quercetin 2,3-dioxygenase C-terminal cupin domain-containing protein n=1 Tax=Pedobacter jamesrossensis TaxID=1908238 RepID=A0ABV8NDS8_9SPHI
MESPVKIYLASQRGLTETSILRRYSTFNFEKYFDEQKQPFESLFLCNDELIANGKLTFFLCKENSTQIFIPIAGGIDIVAKTKEFSVDTGRVLILQLERGEVLEISNPYKDDTINYIQIGIKNDDYFFSKNTLIDFDFEKNPNQLIEIINDGKLPFKLSVGIFAERNEAVYKMENSANSFYTFIIDGTFEIEGRLMHARDGLALLQTESVELKALSNNAIVVALELLPPTP